MVARPKGNRRRCCPASTDFWRDQLAEQSEPEKKRRDGGGAAAGHDATGAKTSRGAESIAAGAGSERAPGAARSDEASDGDDRESATRLPGKAKARTGREA